ncbi:hypothetical protein JCM14036_08230 [Desulfotomaculum defluvii]
MEQDKQGAAWDKLKERLLKAQRIPDGSLHEEKKRILRLRAEILAQEIQKQDIEVCLEVVQFTLSGEQYALESKYIREVFPLRDITPLPCTPDFVMGVVNVRGQIVSVLDFKKIFKLPQKGEVKIPKVMVLHCSDMEFGMLVDEITGTGPLPYSSIGPPLNNLTGKQAAYLRGVTGERLIVLDGEKILSDKDIIVDEEVS